MMILNRDKFNFLSGQIMKWCIYAVIFAAPFSKSISEFCIAVAIILLLFKKFLNSDIRLEKTELNIPFLIFILTIIPSIFNSSHLALSMRAFFTKTLKFVALYFIIVENIDTREKLKDLFVIALLSIIVISIDGLIQYHITSIDLLHQYPAFKAVTIAIKPYPNYASFSYKGFPTASFPFPNDLAAWILLILFPLACVTILDLEKKKIRYFTSLVSLELFYLFFLTKARGAWLGLGVSLVYIAVLKKKIWLIGFLILLVAIPFILKMEMAQYIIATGSISDRVFMWNTGWEIFKHHPIIGNGLNTFFSNFKKYRNDEWKDKKGSYAHNCYLQMAADTGILGLTGFLWLIFSYFYSIIKNLKKIKDGFYNSILLGISMGVFAFLIHSFFDTNLYSLNLATLFWFAIGISQAILKTSTTL